MRAASVWARPGLPPSQLAQRSTHSSTAQESSIQRPHGWRIVIPWNGLLVAAAHEHRRWSSWPAPMHATAAGAAARRHPTSARSRQPARSGSAWARARSASGEPSAAERILGAAAEPRLNSGFLARAAANHGQPPPSAAAAAPVSRRTQQQYQEQTTTLVHVHVQLYGYG